MNEGVGTYPRRRAVIHPGDPALHFEGSTLTYSEFSERVTRLAHALLDRGVKHGDRVAYIGFNHPALLETFFATNLMGATPVLVNPRLTAREVGFILSDCKASIAVYGREQHATVDEISRFTADSADDAPQPTRVQHWIAVEGEPLQPQDASAWTSERYEDVLANASTATVEAEVDDEDIALIMYTSGTTGRPKGAMLTHRNLLYQYLNALLSVDARQDEVHLVSAPLFHIAGLNMVCIPTFMLGGQIVIRRAFRPQEVFEDVKNFGVTSTFLVPAMLDALSSSPQFAEADMHTVRSIMVGGAPLTERSIKPWSDRGVRIQQGFGMTETAPGLALLESRDAMTHAGTAGRPHFFAELRLVDPLTGEDVPDGTAGEVLARGPQVMAGYWNRPEATANALVDGWYHTGDIAVRSEDGYYTIKDRIKDLYISGGENVYPAEVENALLSIHGVEEAAVVGVPDQRWGESGRAFVVVDPAIVSDQEQIRSELLKHLAKYKVPRDILLVEALPRTTTGKIQKNVLRDYSPTDA